MLDFISAHACAVVKEGGGKDAEYVPRVAADIPRPKRARLARRVHQPRLLDGGTQCTACLKFVSRPASVEAFRTEECEGSGASRLVLDALGRYASSNGHRLWMTGQVVWCSICGYHTARRIVGLGQACGAKPAQLQARRNLADGKAPAARKKDVATAKPQRLTVARRFRWRFADSGELEDWQPSQVAERMAADAITADAAA